MLLTKIPLPVARLCRRSLNAKNAKDCHDTAYFAWEVSIRLAVAFSPPSDLKGLVRGSLSHWVRAMPKKGEILLEDPHSLALFKLVTQVGLGSPSGKRSISASDLLDALITYRNKVIGHGSSRMLGFYADAGDKLLKALDVAWKKEVFLPSDTKMVFATKHFS